jgi:parallel beta-helix repeat protein
MNQVFNNNKALTAGTCPGLPSFETNEQMDCGEGIHLLGADHAIVSNNVVEGNSDGILLANDTGNGPDMADAATPGPAGINVYGAGAVTGTIISGNSIQSESVGIAIKTTARVRAHLNSLLGLDAGLANLGSGRPRSARLLEGTGPGVDVAPWLMTPIPAQTSY